MFRFQSLFVRWFVRVRSICRFRQIHQKVTNEYIHTRDIVSFVYVWFMQSKHLSIKCWYDCFSVSTMFYYSVVWCMSLLPSIFSIRYHSLSIHISSMLNNIDCVLRLALSILHQLINIHATTIEQPYRNPIR